MPSGAALLVCRTRSLACSLSPQSRVGPGHVAGAQKRFAEEMLQGLPAGCRPPCWALSAEMGEKQPPTVRPLTGQGWRRSLTGGPRECREGLHEEGGALTAEGRVRGVLRTSLVMLWSTRGVSASVSPRRLGAPENRTCAPAPGEGGVWARARILRGESEAGHRAGTHGQRPGAREHQ